MDSAVGRTVSLEKDRWRDRGYELRVGADPLGRLSWESRMNSRATVAAREGSWRLSRVGVLRKRLEVVSADTGQEAGSGVAGGVSARAWTLSLGGGQFDLQQSFWRKTWVLSAGGTRILEMHMHAGKHPIEMELEQGAPAVALLACCYLALLSARDANAATAAAASSGG